MGRRFGHLIITAVVWAALISVAAAVETRVTRDAGFADFNKGETTGTELLARGALIPGPRAERLAQLDEAVVWSVAVDPFDGVVFFSTGHNGRVYGMKQGKKPELWADLTEVEALSLAVDSTGGLIIGASPGGKIYRVVEPGKPKLLFNTGEQHVWSLVFDRDGTLYAGTGVNGRIYRIRGENNGEVFYDSSSATNVMALAFDSEGRLLAGTQGKGFVLRVTGKDSAFVLHAAAEDEVRSLTVDSDGNIYAAVNGQPVTSLMEQLERDSRTTGTAAGSGGSPRGGIVQIQPSGFVVNFWSAPEGPIQSVLADPVGEGIFVAAGRKGRVYRMLSDTNWSLIADVEEPMVLGLASFKNKVYFAAGNRAALYELQVDKTGDGLFASRTLDAGSTVKWGNLLMEGETPAGTTVTVETRTGNTEDPVEQSWSSWAPAELTAENTARVAGPVARYLQYRLTLRGAGEGAGRAMPRVDSVQFYHVQQNAAPVLREVRVEKAGAPAGPGGAAAGGAGEVAARAAAALAKSSSDDEEDDSSDAALVKARLKAAAAAASASAAKAGTAAPTGAGAKRNSRTFRVLWEARDPNGDKLVYRLFLKGEDEAVWKLADENVEESRAALTTSDMADGRYRLKVEASDARANADDAVSTASRTSDVFLVDNTPPVMEALTAKRIAEGEWEVSARAKDALSIITDAAYNVDAQSDPRAVSPEDGIFDFREETFRFRVKPEEPATEHSVALSITDREGNAAVAKVLLK